MTATRPVTVAAAGVDLPGLVTIPADASGIVVFAHGSDSSRLSPRNQSVAAALNRAGLATLLFDLLTGEEAAERSNVFDIALLAARLSSAATRLPSQVGAGLPLGLFGASTGAAAALVAAAGLGDRVSAVVSRGGRPDLAGEHLPQVTAPTLLIVGSRDELVLELNERAVEQMIAPVHLAVVPGAGHLFSEPGALETVAAQAVDWFCARLSG
ncbi:MAG: alpha/beta hydrolase [Acidimicrobiia bacterium]|nr:alpha/beta hydrolase [Acidimicrobiia bacterium]